MKSVSFLRNTAMSLMAAILTGGVFTALSGIQDAVYAAPPAEAFGKLPTIYDAALSPDAKAIAIVVSKDGNYYLNVANLDKPDEKQSATKLGGAIKPSYVKWANNDQVILSFWQSQKYQGLPIRTGYLYTINVKTMKGEILVDPREEGSKTSGSRLQKNGIFRQFNNVVVDWLEDDPNNILMAYSNKDDNNREPDLRKVNVINGRSEVVKGALPGVQTWYTDLTGEPRIGQGRNDDTTAKWVMRIKDTNSDKWRSSDEYPGLNANANIHAFTSNPNELIVSAYAGKNTVGLYVYDLSVKSITRKIYHNDKYDASGVVLSKDGGEVIGARYTADTPQTEMLGNHDTVMQAMRRKYPDYIIDFVDQSEDGQTVLFKMSNSYDPGALMMVKGAAGEPVGIGELRTSLNSQDLGDVIPVKYKTRDGQKIPSYMTLPVTVTDTAQLKDLPFIVLPHGGPYGRDSKRFDYFAQFFATRGYGVLQMNFRGSDGFGRAHENAGRKNWVVMQEDVEDGTRWLFEKGYADPKRTCIAGWSYGGYAALMGAGKNPDLYNCAISMAGLTDIKAFMNDQKGYRFGRQSVKNFIGNGFADADDVKANSPTKIAADMKVPLFLAHGEWDQQVHFKQYNMMKSALKKSDAKVTYMAFKDEDHYLSNEQNRIKFFKGLDKFLTDVNGKSEFMAP